MAQAMTEDCLIHASAGYTPMGKRRIVPAAAVQPFGRAFAWRPIWQVQLEDAMRADEIFTTLMGDKVEPRREFIEQNSKLVTDLDV